MIVEDKHILGHESAGEVSLLNSIAPSIAAKSDDYSFSDHRGASIRNPS